MFIESCKNSYFLYHFCERICGVGVGSNAPKKKKGLGFRSIQSKYKLSHFEPHTFYRIKFNFYKFFT